MGHVTSDVGGLKFFLVSTFLFSSRAIWRRLSKVIFGVIFFLTSLNDERLRDVLLRCHNYWSAQVANNGEIVVALFGI